jgi:hypothetical protein
MRWSFVCLIMHLWCHWRWHLMALQERVVLIQKLSQLSECIRFIDWTFVKIHWSWNDEVHCVWYQKLAPSIYLCFYNNLTMCSKLCAIKMLIQSLVCCCDDNTIERSTITMCNNAITTSYQWLYQHFAKT